MSRHRNTTTGVVVSVDDSKDDRFSGPEWESLDSKATRSPKSKSASK